MNYRTILILILFFAIGGCASQQSDGQTYQWCRSCGGYKVVQRTVQRTVERTNTGIYGTSGHSIVVNKLRTMQRSRRMFHPGGGYVRGANKEGVGFSTRSPQAALNNCCYSYRRPWTAYAVGRGYHRGRYGWLAIIQTP